jgi:hypothetical protein
MTHNPEGCFYSAISLINNSFHHLSDYREAYEYTEKMSDDQDRQICFNPGFQVVTGGCMLLTHTCNPSYSGGREQKDHSLKPSLANCL